jgi:hypothetical protein
LAKAAAFIRALVYRLVLSLKRFPEALLFSALTVSVIIYINHYNFGLDRAAEENFQRIAMMLALGIPVFLCIKAMFELSASVSNGRRASVYVLGFAFIALYYILALKDIGMVSVSRYMAISLSLYLAFVFIPYIKGRENFELYVIKLFTSFCITYIYSLVLFLGFVAMLFTIDTLFTVNISERLYFDIFLVVGGIFAPAYFLADIPGPDYIADLKDYPKVLRVLVLYIVMPLIVAYSIILYAYFAKIIVTTQWPVGMVSNLVLWYSIICTVVIFFILPLRDMNRWAAVFISTLPKGILPLLVMMFISMGIRINAYGVTESRYYVLLVGLWVVGCMLYFIINKKPGSVVLPISIALISVLSVTGPWSCYSVSKLSQNNRLERMLQRNGMIVNGSIVKPAGEVSKEDKYEISQVIRYFDQYHSLKDIRCLPEDFRVDRMNDIFGFELHGVRMDNGGREHFFHDIRRDGMLLDVKHYDYLVELSMHQDTYAENAAMDMAISFSHQDRELSITKNGIEVYHRDVTDIAKELYSKNRDKQQLEPEDMTISDRNADIEVLYVFNAIHGREQIKTGDIDIEYMELYVLIR